MLSIKDVEETLGIPLIGVVPVRSFPANEDE